MRHVIGEAHELGGTKEYPPVDYKSVFPAFTAMQNKLGTEIEKMVHEYKKIVTNRYVRFCCSLTISLTLDHNHKMKACKNSYR